MKMDHEAIDEQTVKSGWRTGDNLRAHGSHHGHLHLGAPWLAGKHCQVLSK